MKKSLLAIIFLGLWSLPSNSQTIAAAHGHSLSVCTNGSLQAWGWNNSGQVGDSSTTDRRYPVQVHDLSGVKAVASFFKTSMALKQDSTVWTWGFNYAAEPAQISGITATAIAAGSSHCLVLKPDSTIWTWGYNGYGALGNGTTTTTFTPVRATGLTQMVAIAGGDYHSLGVKADGTVWAWGINSYGALGDNTTIQRTMPVQVLGLTNVIRVSASLYASFALKSDGTVWSWGRNYGGQLGDGTLVEKHMPVQVIGLTNIVAISAGEEYCLAVKSDGTVWAWGLNNNFQLGDHTQTDRSTPIQTPGITNAVAVAGGGYHSMAIKSDGTVWTWGLNAWGGLGDSSVTSVAFSPIHPVGLCYDASCAPSASITAGGSTALCTGDSLLLNASTGTGLNYQWKLNGSNISGATTSSYLVTAAGNYTCRIINSCGDVTSNTIAVTVVAAPTATINPGSSTSLCTGGSVLLSAVTGTGYSYQWNLNGSAIPGAILSSYAAASAGNYTCVVTVSCGSRTSNSITVTVNPLPTAAISTVGSTTFCIGGSVTLNANTGTALNYQWKRNSVNITGAATSSYAATTSGNYTCVVTNSCGSITSNSIVVTVNTVPTAQIIAMGSTTFCSGGTVSLYTNAGIGLSYQWKRNGSNIPGSTSTSYTASAGGNYSCQVTNACGSTTSNIMVVTVVPFIPAVPGAINGQMTGICGNTETYAIAPVAGATAYNWTVPAGVTINNGQGTTSLTVSFPLSFIGGNISVLAQNACGASAWRSTFVSDALAPPGPILGLHSVCAGKRYVYSIPPVDGATTYHWTVPLKATIVSGQGTTTIDVRMFKVPGNIIVTASNACTSGATAVLPITITDNGCGPVHRENRLIVEAYPNPSSTEFTLKLFSDDDSPCHFILRDITGRELERRTDISPGREISFGNELANGIYFAEVQQGEERMVKRVVKSTNY